MYSFMLFLSEGVFCLAGKRERDRETAFDKRYETSKSISPDEGEKKGKRWKEGWVLRRQQKRLKEKRSIETIVRHSRGCNRSGEICQTDVHPHARSHIWYRMHCFWKLWRHYAAILPRTPRYRQPSFTSHGVREGHLKHTHTNTHRDPETKKLHVSFSRPLKNLSLKIFF